MTVFSKDNSEFYRTLFDVAADAIFAMEGPLFVYCNKKTLEMFDCEEEDIIGHSPIELSPEIQTDGQPSAEKAMEKINAAMAGTPQLFEWTHITKNNKPFYTEVSLNAFESNGSPILLAIVRNISKRKEIEQELEKHRNYLEELVEERTKSLKQSEKRFKDLSYSIADWIWEVDINGNYTFSSKGVENILGYTKQEVIGNNVFDFFNVENLEEKKAEALKVIKKAEPIIDFSAWYKTKDNHDVCLLTNGIPVFDENKKLIGYRGIDKDITETVKMQENLHKMKKRLEAITFNLVEGIIVIDRDSKILFSNPAAKEILHINEEIKERNIHDIFSVEKTGKNKNFCDTSFQQALEKNATETENDAFFATDSEYRVNVSFSCSPLIEDGITSGVVISFRDITKRKNMEREALQSMKLAGIGQLASGIAHEINTPTQFVSDNLRFLEESFSDILKLTSHISEIENADSIEDYKNSAEQISKIKKEIELDFIIAEAPSSCRQALEGTQRISKIVQAMRDFSTNSEEKDFADINRAISNTLTVCENEWKLFAKIETVFDENLPKVPCYIGELNQAILNIVVNAAHAIEEKHMDKLGRITIRTKKQDEEAVITIEDNGTGIKEENFNKVFEPFFTTKKVGKGTGQGMSITYSIVTERHKGHISFESTENKGTVFTIKLPLHNIEHEQTSF